MQSTVATSVTSLVSLDTCLRVKRCRLGLKIEKNCLCKFDLATSGICSVQAFFINVHHVFITGTLRRATPPFVFVTYLARNPTFVRPEISIPRTQSQNEFFVLDSSSTRLRDPTRQKIERGTWNPPQMALFFHYSIHAVVAANCEHLVLGTNVSKFDCL